MRYEILIDKLENPRKCTIHPLRDRGDFTLRYFRGNRPIAPFESEVLLHVEGICLSERKGTKPTSLALIDSTWKKVGPTLNRVERPLPELVKIPAGFVTAYPRRNKEGKDPLEGLATVEALFIAAAFLGNWDETLLEHYHFGKDFLAHNDLAWKKYGIRPH